MTAWSRWVAWTGRQVDPRPLIWLRMLLPLAVVGDYADMLLRGAHRGLLADAAHGGMYPRSGDFFLFPGTSWGGPLVMAITTVAMLLVSAGKWTRPALVIAILGSGQVGHLYPWGDRAIDHIIRTVLIVLLFSPVSAREVGATITGWTEDVIRWLLVMIYFCSGLNKITSSTGWLVPSSSPDLYRILTSPVEAHLDPYFWADYAGLFFVAGVITVMLEMGAPVLLWRKWAPYWCIGGATIHLGIAFTMKLGMFSWGMLAFYPMLFAPWILPRIDSQS